MLLLAIVFSTGMIHGIGPDHLAAITAFGAAAGGNFRRIIFFAIRFAMGHVVVLAAAGLFAKFGSLLLPATWEHRFELFTGWLLVGMGVILLIALLSGLVVHSHPHDHHGDHHGHFHIHVGVLEKHEHVHGGLAWGMGALFALGGARSLIMVAPIALAPTVIASVVRIAAFGMGIVISMVAYAFLTQRALERLTAHTGPKFSHRIMMGSAYAIALFCVIAGVAAIQGKI